MLVQTGGDEAPDLMQHKGHGQEQGADQRELEWRQKGGSHVGGNHAGASGHQRAQWLRDEAVDVIGKVKQRGKDHQPDADDTQ